MKKITTAVFAMLLVGSAAVAQPFAKNNNNHSQNDYAYNDFRKDHDRNFDKDRGNNKDKHHDKKCNKKNHGNKKHDQHPRNWKGRKS
jgi:Ni/Co efflux regulator RcnB